jgi:iron(III) transport system permease protein
VRPLSRSASAAVIAAHLLVIGLALLPHTAVVLNALGRNWFFTALPAEWTTEHLQEALAHPLAGIGLRNSLLFSLCSTAIDVVLGLACAWVIVRRGGWWGRLVDGISLAPLAVPGLVLAFGYVGAYGHLFQQSWQVSGWTVAPGVGAFLVLSYAIRRLPYTVRACVAGLEQTPQMLEEAAASLGAGAWQRLRRITFPLLSANIVAGGILAFSFAMLEVSDSIVLASHPRDFPLTKAIYQLFGNPGNGDQLASALGLVALVFLTVSLLAASAILGKKWSEMMRG